MFVEVVRGEMLVRVFSYNGIPLELVRCPASVWCGALGYAPNCTDEPDVGNLLARYQGACDIPKRERANPEWSCCISIDYWQDGAVPRGMIFAQQVLTRDQDSAHDVYCMSESLYIRAAVTKEAAQAAFGRDSCEPYELFGIIKNAMEANGYSIAANGAQEIEMYNHAAGGAYAYVPVA